MNAKLKSVYQMGKDTVTAWSDDNVSRLSAALAYYTVLSIAPLLIVAVSIAGFVFGDDAARGQVSAQLTSVMGPEASEGIETILANARAPETGIWSSIVGMVVLFFGASGVFGELQSALDTVWEVEPKPNRGFWGIVKDRFFSFTMVLGVAFLLLVSLVVSTVLSAMGSFFSHALPGGEILWQVGNFVISMTIIAFLFALIFKVVPDAKIAWRDVWPGAIATAVLFTIGKFALGLYLGKESTSSAYGAAGSFVALIIWVYYAAQILLLGAEFTQVYAKHRGSPILPSDNAVAKKPEGAPRAVAATSS